MVSVGQRIAFRTADTMLNGVNGYIGLISCNPKTILKTLKKQKIEVKMIEKKETKTKVNFTAIL